MAPPIIMHEAVFGFGGTCSDTEKILWQMGSVTKKGANDTIQGADDRFSPTKTAFRVPEKNWPPEEGTPPKKFRDNKQKPR